MGSQFGDIGFEIVGKNQDFWRGVLENFEQFVPVQTPVERGVNRAEFGAGKKDIEMLVPVARQNRHPVAFAHALGFQPVRQLVGALVGLAKGQPPFRAFPGINEGQFVGTVEFSAGKVITNVHGCSSFSG